ncbi:MAG: hypothetical protein R2762_03375 [Bryobacteraceae bacterium]
MPNAIAGSPNVMFSLRQWVALTLVVCVPPAAAQTAILQIQVLEGEGAVQAAGQKALRPITVQITDETGKPVNGAAVSFRLPGEEVTGVFGNGLKSNVVVTGVDGRATEWSIRWGSAPGPARIRITAAKDQARAGAIVNQYVADTLTDTRIAAEAPHAETPAPVAPVKVEARKLRVAAPTPAAIKPPAIEPTAILPTAGSGITIFETPKGARPGMSRSWWLMLAAGLGGGAAAYFLTQRNTNGSAAPDGSSAGAVTQPPAGIRFGSPVITIGRP